MKNRLKTLRALVRDSLIGGVLVILPLSITFVFANWLLSSANKLISPLTSIFTNNLGLPQFLSIPVVVAILLASAVMIGSVVRTRAGEWVYGYFDDLLSKKVPGYKTIKEITGQVFSRGDSPFSRGIVARAQIFGPDVNTSVTGLVTSQHSDGIVTVFVPTGPNPTSGQIFHLPKEQVELFPDASIEAMMRSIIACGAGSNQLFTMYTGEKPE